MTAAKPSPAPGCSHELRVQDLTVSYRRVPALHHLSFQVACGQSVALLGPNGAGKTTLLKALAGLVAREAGTISYHGRKIQGTSRDFAYLPQRGSVDWDFPVTVRGVVEMGRYGRLGWWRPWGREDDAAVDQALATMQLDGLEGRQVQALSGGQQQRVFLARALAQGAHVFLLDEPFTGLDKPAQEGLGVLLHGLRDAGKLILASHHDLRSVPELFDRVLLLNGELLAAGAVADAFTPHNIERAYSTRAFTGQPHPHHAAA